jgi:anti-sigma regulatory factor (Ser/Thr protein kinase)
MTTHRRTFPGRPEALGTLRHWVRDLLDGHPRADDAELIASELGTNAVRHTASGTTHGSIRVAVRLAGRSVAIAITDQGTTDSSPQVRHPGADSTRGRGLDIVAALADGLSIEGTHQGRTVTAVLLRDTADHLPATAHGYRCECHVQSPTTGGTPKLVAAYGTTEAEQAIRWIRRYVTTLTVAVDATTREQVAQWISTDHAKALDDLQRGQLCSFATGYADMHLEWTARPVIFLPLLPPPGKPVISYTPACAHADRHAEFEG